MSDKAKRRDCPGSAGRLDAAGTELPEHLADLFATARGQAPAMLQSRRLWAMSRC